MELLRQPSSDITHGSIWKILLSFFYPLWIGMFFQQLYNTVDTIVVGQFVGKIALASVGSTSVIVNLTVGIFTGLASGALVVIAQQFGADKWENLQNTIHTALSLGTLLGTFFMIVGFLLTPWLLELIDTPEDALSGAVLYLRVYFLGMIPSTVYNMGTSVLRAIGDFRRPLYFLVAASACNIVLDLILVLVLHMGVAGVAVATVCSQILSAILVLFSLIQAEAAPYRLFLKRLCIYASSSRAILAIGIPTALQSLTYSVSNIVIQAFINSFGTDTVAAWTAYNKMDILFWMTATAMAQSLTTFSGQNFGAGQYQRVKNGFWTAIVLLGIFTILISVLFFFMSRPILSFFTTDPDVLRIGVTMARFMSPCYITYIFIELIAASIRGTGKSIAIMLISIFGICALRLLWLFAVVPLHHTLIAVLASYPVTWTTTSLLLFLYYRFANWLRAIPS